MLTINLKPVLEARGIKKPLPFMVKAGISYQTSIALIKNPVTTLRLQHLEKLCRALNCTPNDLIEWKPDKSDTIASSHPLQELKRDTPAIDLHDVPQSLPLSKLKELTEILKKNTS